MKQILVLLLATLFYNLSFADQRLKDKQVGEYIPFFSIESNKGKHISTDSLIGKPSVIVFFNTKCWDCRRELPIVNKLYLDNKEKCNFICISRQQGFSEIAEYWELQDFSLPFSAQNDKSVFRLFARRTIPRIYLIDAKGMIKKIFVEKTKERKLKKSLKILLEQQNINK